MGEFALGAFIGMLLMFMVMGSMWSTDNLNRRTAIANCIANTGEETLESYKYCIHHNDPTLEEYIKSYSSVSFHR